MAREYKGPDSPPGAFNDWIINVVDVDTERTINPGDMARKEVVETQVDSNGVRPRLTLWVQGKS